MSIICGLIYLFIFCGILLWCWRDARKPPLFPPGPSWIPFVGSIPLIKKLHHHYGFYHLVWDHLSRKYGSIVGVRTGRDLLIIISGVDAIKKFYTTEAFNGRPNGFFYKIRTQNERCGVVFNDGPIYEMQKRYSLKIFRQLGMGKSIMNEHIQMEIQEMIKCLKLKNSSSIAGINIAYIFDIVTLNTIWALMVGKRFQLDDQRLPKILDSVHKSFRVIDMSGGLLNQLPFIRFLAPELSGYAPLLRAQEPLLQFIKEAVTEIRQNPHGNDEFSSFIDAYLIEIERSTEYFTDEQLHAICLDLFQAGTETTGNTLTFAIIYMLHYPRVQHEIRNELDKVCGRDRLPNLNDRIQLPYIEAVINEVQRIANVAPLAIAHRSTDNAVFSNYIVPENTIALISLYSLHMNVEYWKDPHVFRPERFLDEDRRLILHNNYFMPFGLGKRRCMGENLAKTNLFLIFSSFMHTFNFTIPENEQLPELIGYDGITVSPKPFKIIVKSR